VQQLPNHATGVRTAVHLYPPTCVQGGGDVSALCTVCLLILSRGQAGEAPPRNTAEGGLNLASSPNTLRKTRRHGMKIEHSQIADNLC
jgi:hypothetical protein